MKFSCKFCEYTTSLRCNYERHLGTYKHHKNKKKGSKKPRNEVKRPRNELKNPTIVENRKKYHCECCNFTTIYKGDFRKHLNSKRHNLIFQCVKIYIDKEMESQEELVKTKELLYEAQLKIKDLEKDIEHLKEIKDICKKSNKSVMQIIINNYNNAPNLEAPPIEDMTKKDFQRYINKGVPKGLVEMIKDHYVTDIPNEERSLWCVDQSRLKYLIRAEDKWKVDLMGETFRKTLIPPIRKRVMEMTQERDNDYYEFMRLADSVMKIDKGRYQNKVMKEISNMFLLDDKK